MIWLTWQQHRKQALFTLIAMAALAAVMVPTGLAMHNAFAELGLADCAARAVGASGPDKTTATACGAAIGQFSARYGTLMVTAHCSCSCRCSSGCSGARRWSPARSNTAPIGWSGRRASAGGDGRW